MASEKNPSELPGPGDEILEDAARRLGAAVRHLWPDAELVGGGTTALPFHGFYQDLDLPRRLTPDDLFQLARTLREDGRCRPLLHVFQEVREVLPRPAPSRESRERPLQRLLGVAAASDNDLQLIQARLERAAERDHRWIGRSLRLFEELPERAGEYLWLPHGAWLLRELLERARCLLSRDGFDEVKTPPRDGGPDHAAVFACERRGATQLPVRFFEISGEARQQPSLRSEGLRHARHFTRDAVSIFCTRDQAAAEIGRLIDLARRPYESCGVPLQARVALPAGEEVLPGIREILRARQLEPHGGPAVSGVGIDFFAPNRFGNFEHAAASVRASPPGGEPIADDVKGDVTYVIPRAPPARPWAIRGTLSGSFEALAALLIERTAGAFPLWLAPIQVRVVSVATESNAYAAETHRRLLDAGFRSELDQRLNKIQTKRRDALRLKIPYPLLVGSREAGDRTVATLPREPAGEPRTLALEKLIDELRKELAREPGF
ncbi:MAG: His/Gly/Thr/Pro-type tRNA ligase C-terminal domain-containing protein [Planctomycetota bacterium]|nr:His/Gly/Thr/Pro-type tRNA ligase C-terminal domain-containing protein [Planctomycetota bacterium]